MDSSFGTWIKRRRKALDLTQQQLAQKVGCSVSAIIKIEAEERRPSHQIAELLAKHLEVPSDQTIVFLKVARQERAVDLLDSISSFSVPQPDKESASSPGEPASVSKPLKAELPFPPTPLLGREHEMQTVFQQLSDPGCRLLTLTGPGGVGKTRLGLEVANRSGAAFPDGVYFIELAGVDSPDFIPFAIANKLGLTSSSASTPNVQLAHFLQDKHVLLVLDNLEHLQAGAGLLGELLEQTEKVKLLTTSREPLNLRAEWVLGVQGLPLPQGSSVNEMESSSAVKFFLRCAKQTRMDFELADEDRFSVLRICQLVEGLPLGIELAAAWVRVLSCDEIVQEIEHNISFLSTSVRDVPERHRSMVAVFTNSWKLLSEEERQVFMKLSVFRGGFTREAATQVAGATLPLLSTLIDKSLLHRSDVDRFDQHELLRQFAREQLLQSQNFEHACDLHLEYFLAFTEKAAGKLQGAEQLDWLDRLEQDHDNLRSALEWSLRLEADPGEMSQTYKVRMAQESLKLSGTLYWFWKRRDHWSEGRKWLQRSLARAKGLPVSIDYLRTLNAAALLAVEQADTQTAYQLAEENLSLSRNLEDRRCLASALNSMGQVLWKRKDFAAARAHCEEGLAIFRELDDPFGVADTLHWLGHIAVNQDDYEATQTYLDESLSISREIEHKIGIVEAIADLGLLAYLRKDYETAQSYLEDSLVRFREAHLIPGMVSALNRLGDIARCLGDYESAGELYSEAMALYRDMGDLDEIPSILHNLAYIAHHRGDPLQALALFQEGLAIQHQMGNRAGVAECLLGIAGVSATQGQTEKGMQLFSAAEALRQIVGASLWPANQVEFERILDCLQAAADPMTLEAAQAAGRALSLEQAVQLAHQA